MLMTERQTKIAGLINKKGSVQVDELAEILNVSTMTIRRDLEKLDQEGVLIRCHGGAVANKEVNYEEKQVSNHKEKLAIAAKAAELIKEDMVIFLDAGTTTYEIAKYLYERKDVRVVTTDLEIARLLRGGQPELLLCGGTVQKETGSILGYFATQMIESFHFDLGFLGAAIIDEKLNVLTPTVEKAFLKRQIVSQCQASYLVVDSTKFGRDAIVKINHLSDYTGAITNFEKVRTMTDNIIYVEV